MKRLAIACLTAVTLCAANAQAAGCSLSTGGIAFGNYRSAGPAVSTTAVLTVLCFGTPGEVVQYGISLSPGSSADFHARTLRAGPHAVAYNIYTTAAFVQVIGDGTAGTARLSGTITLGSGSGAAAHLLHARAPGAQPAAPGSYSDTLIVAIEF